MNKILLLKGFNNYQNRIYREAPSLQSYRDTVGSSNYIDYTQDRSFNINDGVSSEITINITDPTKQDFMADYCIVYEVVKRDDNSDNDIEVIKSRWFVIEQRWNRQGQYIASLRRDLLVDYRNKYDTAPMLISKGYPTEGTTELFNSEGMQYSQIKTHQFELGNPDLQWIVCYLNKSRKGYDLSSFTNPLILGQKNGYPAVLPGTGDVRRIPDPNNSDKYRINFDGTYIWVDSTTQNILPDKVDLSESDNKKIPEIVEAFAPSSEGITPDAAYDIIAFPYSKKRVVIEHPDGTTTQIPPEQAIQIAMNLKYTMQDDLYDIQLIPYDIVDGTIYRVGPSPAEGEINAVFIDVDIYAQERMLKTYDVTGSIQMVRTTNGGDELIDYVEDAMGTSTGTNKYYGFNIPNKDIERILSFLYPYDISSSLEAKKVDSECRFVRVCSPTGSSMWDYNIVKKGDTNDEQIFILRGTLKPGQPYFHLKPLTFGGLYGKSFDKDTRGLIDTSSHSLSTVVDSWMQYVQQNSNYQSIFNRQIESMEVQRFWQTIENGANIITGGLGGMFGGTALGRITGNEKLMGGLFAGANIAGGLVDTFMQLQLMNDKIDLAKDMHSMNLAQIKARPDTLTKVSNVDIDSHLLPYVEIYSASEDEIEYLKRLLKYRGYTINRINTFSEQYFNAFIDAAESVFISGRLIECAGLNEDAHTFSELNNELMTGVRIIL